VIKIADKLSEHELIPQFEAVLRRLFARIPFLKLESLRSDVLLQPRTRASTLNRYQRADWLLKVKASTQSWTLIAEAKKLGQPREVRTAILQLRHYLSLLPAGRPSYGIILAPYISEESARLCEEAGMGYADLAGNAFLSFGQVFIQRRLAENPFYEKRAVKSIFTPKAARILRQLLQGPLQIWKVKDLAFAAGVSLGHVSSVRQQLLDQEWAVEESPGIRITRPEAVLDAWAASDRWKERTETREYSLLLKDPLEIATQLHSFLGSQPHAFTQWLAAGLRHPHSSTPVTTVYVKQFPDEQNLQKQLLARRVETGGSLRLVIPSDEGVMNPLQTVHGLPLVSDVQLYLDLTSAGLRGEEAARELRQWKDFSGGWS
jgi:hypothetical protein